MNFEDIRVRDLVFFERLAVAGSITSTAKEIGVPKATASRWLINLEERIGHSLIKRTTRSFALTDMGHEFAIHVREILSAVSAAELALQSDIPRGTLRVSIPVPMGRIFAGPVIASFRRRLPTVRLEIKFQNERVDLIRDRFDLAIRGPLIRLWLDCAKFIIRFDVALGECEVPRHVAIGSSLNSLTTRCAIVEAYDAR